MMEVLRKQKPKKTENAINQPISSLQKVLNYELQDLDFVKFIFAVRKLADIKANNHKYVLVTDDDLETNFVNKNMVDFGMQKLMLLGGMINKSKNNNLTQKGGDIELSYIFNRYFLDRIVINAVDKIVKDGKVSEYFEDINKVLEHPYFYKPEIAKMPYKAFVRTTYWQIVKRIAWHWSLEM